MVQNQNNKQALANNLKSKSCCIYTLCDDVICFRLAKNKNTLVCIGSTFPFLLNAIRVINQFKENFKTSRTMKEATKENKNDVSRWTQNVQHMVWPRCHSSSPLLRAAKSVSQDCTKVNLPMKLGSSLL